jgi:hypothetical protein
VEKIEHEKEGVLIEGRLPVRLLSEYRPYLTARAAKSVQASAE